MKDSDYLISFISAYLHCYFRFTFKANESSITNRYGWNLHHNKDDIQNEKMRNIFHHKMIIKISSIYGMKMYH